MGLISSNAVYNRAMGEDFIIAYHDGWAYLKVRVKAERRKEIYPEQILNRMKLLGIPPVRQKILEDRIKHSDGSAHKLAPWPEGETFSAKTEISISEDFMEVRIIVQPPKPGGEAVSEHLLLRDLSEAGVVYGIDKKRVQDIAYNQLYQQEFLIARGKLPEEGHPSQILYHFITEKKPFKELRYGRIDLKELNFVQNREEGSILAEIIPAKEAIPGKRVNGEILAVEQPAGKVELKAGSNTEIRDNKVVALMKGNACLKDGAVQIEPLLELKNVDYRSGNIDFDGSVIIKGTVADGFSVKATGDIETGKCVGRVQLEAGRNLLLRSGVNGDNEAKLSCGADCISRYIEGASLICRGNLTVQESIMHSGISVWGNVLLSGGRAELIGGSILVKGTLWCRKLGGLYETPTAVIIGISPDMLQEYSRILVNLDKKRKALDKLDREMKGVLKGSTEFLSLQEKEKTISTEMALIQHKMHDMKRETLPDPQSLLVAEDRIYGGVKLSFGFIDYPVGQGGIRQVVLRFHGKKIQQSGFNPADPPEVA